MQSEKDALIERYAGDAFKNRNNPDLTIGVWRQHFVEFSDKMAALSAAEPRGYLVHDKDNPDGRYFKQKPSISDDDMSEYEIWMEPLYAAPPAPSVAVKELPYHCDVCTVPGYGDAPCSPLCDRPALSAQVQDVAGWQLVGEVVPYRGALSSLTNGRDLKLNTHVSHLEIGTKLYAAAPAKQEVGHD